MKLQMLLSKIMGFMGAITTDANGNKVSDGINFGKDTPDWIINIMVPIINVLDSLLLPIIIVLGTAGMIYGIVLGVQYSKAETADKRDEAKKRMINAIIGILIVLILLILMKVFTANAYSIFGWVEQSATTPAA